MKKNNYLLNALWCVLLCATVANAQERIMFSKRTYSNEQGGGLYYLNKDGSGTVDYASNFIPSKVFGKSTDYFIVSQDGEIVGINAYGGSYFDGQETYGTLYRITKNGVTIVQNYNYSQAPNFLVEGWSDGKLYGTGPRPPSGAQILQGTKQDGLSGSIIYKYGFRPGEILAAKNGLIYGTAPVGGTYGQGYIYKFVGNNIEIVYSFKKVTGYYPQGQLTQGQDGNIYGVTKRGGLKDQGVIFRIKIDGTGFQVIHSFDKLNGQYPDRGLVQDDDGNFYGMTYQGGIYNKGVVYKIRPDGSAFAKLHDFSVSQTYSSGVPQSLLLDSDGFLYGKVPQSGGMLFRVKKDGLNFKVLYKQEAYISTIRLVNSITPTYKVRDPENGAANVSTSRVITADSVPGAVNYTLEISLNPDFNPIRTYVFSDSHKIFVGELNSSTKYYFRVKTSLWTEPGPVTSFTTFNTANTSIVTTPANNTSDASAPTLKVTVKALAGAKRYTVQLNTSGDFSGVSLTQTSAIDNQRTLTLTGLKYNTKYYARVRTELSTVFGRVTFFTTRAEPFSEVNSSTSLTSNSESPITVYPNPSKSSFKIESTVKAYRELDMEITDFTGTVVQRFKLKDGALNIGEDLPRGIYVLKVSHKNTITQYRLVKE